MNRNEYLSADQLEPGVEIHERVFEVTFVNGVKKTVVAHFCDTTSSPAGHVIFIEVDTKGTAWHRYVIQKDVFLFIEEIFKEPAVPGVH